MLALRIFWNQCCLSSMVASYSPKINRLTVTMNGSVNLCACNSPRRSTDDTCISSGLEPMCLSARNILRMAARKDPAYPGRDVHISKVCNFCLAATRANEALIVAE